MIRGKRGGSVRKSAAVVVTTMALLTLCSKGFGFIRELFLASFFGTSYVVDAYVMSLNVPQLIFQGLLVGVATTFIPAYAGAQKEESPAGADLFASRTLNAFLIVAAAVSIAGVVFSDQLVYVIAHGWFSNPSMQPAIELADFFVKITFPAILFFGVSEILDAYQRYHHHYYTPIMAGYSYSIMIIVFILIAHRFGNRYIVFGALSGHIIRMLINAAMVRRRGYRHRWDFHLTAAVKRVLLLAIPVSIGTYLTQITIFFDKLIASWLPEGSVAALNYGSLVTNLFAGIVGVMIANYLYPRLSRAFANGDMQEWRGSVNSGVSVLLMIGVPLTLGCMLYSRQLITIIFERNAFDSASTDVTSTVFFWYVMGLAFLIPIGFLTQVFYSAKNTRTPVILSSICAGVNIAGNVLLMRPMGIGGIALSTSIAFALNFTLLIAIMNRKWRGMLGRGLVYKGAKILGASVAAVAVSFPVYRLLQGYIPAGGTIRLLLPLACAALLAIIVYLLLLRLAKVEEVYHVRELFKAVASKDDREE
jgi:putative peptidoglycan lipid II flippase